MIKYYSVSNKDKRIDLDFIVFSAQEVEPRGPKTLYGDIWIRFHIGSGLQLMVD